MNIDTAHIWHPYQSAHPTLPAYPVAHADHCTLTLEDGRQLIDGMSSWWCAIHGYNHPALNTAITQQLQSFAHIMFGGLTHQPAIQLTEKLLAKLPTMQHVFYSDSGSVSIEVALKMALQYQNAKGTPHRNKFATIRGGYHGDTWHPMSICDPETGMHTLYQGKLAAQYFLPRPTTPYHANTLNTTDQQALDNFFHTPPPDLAAFILEPIVQGAGGMWFYHPDYLRRLHTHCQTHNIPLILDEIATGFGRTGYYFAHHIANITPDIICLGKALTGGTITLAATLTTAKIADTISNGNPPALMHGPTFMGNALACAAACASLDLLDSTDWQTNIKRIETHFTNTLLPLKRPYIKHTRVLGAIGVIELNTPLNLTHITPKFIDAGIWVRPFGTLAYLMPPYIISNDELHTLTTQLIHVLDKHYSHITS